ncbi:hypothetical protein SPHINGO8AM_40231 [Sphingomonas sp. 8AM]|nr:hypothetical protein SPHINGO8AM_40231 [Sphingomonas sp. 8AM]
MDAGIVSRTRHQPIKRINLADKVSLSEAADRWVAGHGTNLGEGLRDQRNVRATPHRCSCRFSAGVTPADYNDVVLFHVEHSFSETKAPEQGV